MAEPPLKKQKAEPPAEHVPSCGAPRYRPSSGSYSTKGGVIITRNVRLLSVEAFMRQSQRLVSDLDRRRGCIFESSYEYPGRYSRWTMGFVDPPLAFESWQRRFEVR